MKYEDTLAVGECGRPFTKYFVIFVTVKNVWLVKIEYEQGNARDFVFPLLLASAFNVENLGLWRHRTNISSLNRSHCARISGITFP